MSFEKMRFQPIGMLCAMVFLLWGCAEELNDEMLAQLSPKEAGRKVFEARCMRCHTISGVGGSRGPNLSDVGAKMDRETLERFIKDPPSVRPGVRMRRIPLSDLQLEVVTGYLSELK